MQVHVTTRKLDTKTAAGKTSEMLLHVSVELVQGGISSSTACTHACRRSRGCYNLARNRCLLLRFCIELPRPIVSFLCFCQNEITNYALLARLAEWYPHVRVNKNLPITTLCDVC